MITRTHSAWPLIAAACSAVPPATASVDRDLSTARGSAPCARSAAATVCRPARAAAMSGVAPSENSTLAPAPHRRRDETTAPAPRRRRARVRSGSSGIRAAVSIGAVPRGDLEACGRLIPRVRGIPAAVHPSMTKAAHQGCDAAAAGDTPRRAGWRRS